MIIRPAIPQDALAIAHVHVTTWQATYAGIVPQAYLDTLSEADFAARWADWLLIPDILICVAEVDSAIVGFASGGPIRKTIDTCDGELYAIYILPEMHRRGIGRQLASRIQTGLISQGRQQILAWVLRDNPATAFYKRLGGKLVTEDCVEIGGITLPELGFAWPLTEAEKS